MRHGCRAKPQQRAIQESEQGRGSVAARGTTAERAEGSSAWEMRGADDKREEMRRELLQNVQATWKGYPDARKSATRGHYFDLSASLRGK